MSINKENENTVNQTTKHVDYNQKTSDKNNKVTAQQDKSTDIIHEQSTTSKHIPIICLFVDPYFLFLILPSPILSCFLSKHKLQWFFFTFYKILNGAKKHCVVGSLSVLFLACLHSLCPLRNAIAPPKTMSLKSSSWTLTWNKGCGVGSSIDFPKPQIQGLNCYDWGLRCVNHSKTITVKDQECLKQKMTSVYLNPVAGLHWRMGRN